MGTGQIITDGIQAFTPVTNRLFDIVMELIQYFIYITLGRLGICLIWGAVKYIIGTLSKKSNETIREIKTNNDEVNQMIIESRKERNTERELYDDYQDYIYKHGKYKDGNYPTQEERIKRIMERKRNHPGYEYF